MKMMKVAITIRSFDSNNPFFDEFEKKTDIIYVNESGHRLSENEIISVAEKANAVIAGTELYSRDVIKNLHDLSIISRVGVGLDNIDLEFAKERNIKIYNTPEAPASAVAEHTISLIFDLVKRISEYKIRMSKNDLSTRPGILLYEKTVGIIGMGRIGSRVGKLLECIGCSIVFYDPYVTEIISNHWKRFDSLKDLIQNSDIITIHVPAQKNGLPLLDDTQLSYFNKDKFLINTARSSLIDEEVLIKMIMEGEIGGAGLDVFSDEFVDKISGIYDYNIVLTPHVASNTYESRKKMETESMMNILKHMDD